MIGYACGKAAIRSAAVFKVSELLYEKNYSAIEKLLNSRLEAEKFLAVIVLERLEKEGKFKIEAKTGERIIVLYKSKRMVSVCSGCLYRDKIRLAEALDKEGTWWKRSQFWLDSKFED